MTNSPLYYVDRETGRRESEVIYGEAELDFLYGNVFGKILRKMIAKRIWFSALNSLPKKAWFSKRKVLPFIERYGIDADEAEKPVHEYHSLDAFFTRKLKMEIRPICRQDDALVAPADGRVLAYRIDNDLTMRIKHQQVSVAELLEDKQQAEQLLNGWALVVRLAPKDYHRFHFPADGVASPPKNISGLLESVHPIALNAGACSFLNKRTCTRLDTDRFGQIFLVAVGALTVGTIIPTYNPGIVSKGQEQGYFRFGGSTVILLFKGKEVCIDQDILVNTEAGIETLVKYGTQIASLRPGRQGVINVLCHTISPTAD